MDQVESTFIHLIDFNFHFRPGDRFLLLLGRHPNDRLILVGIMLDSVASGASHQRASRQTDAGAEELQDEIVLVKVSSSA